MVKRYVISAVLLIMLLVPVIIYGKTSTQKVSSSKENIKYAAYESNRYLGFYEESKAKANVSITSEFQLFAENEKLALYLKTETLAIRILNKETGYIWSSNLDSYEGERLNGTWKSYFESGITIEYYEVNAKTQDFKISQESLLTSSKTTVSAVQRQDGFEANVLFGDSSVQVTFSVYLRESGIEVSLKPEDIKEEEDSPKGLVSVTFFPFLGNTKEGDQEGYFFLPDGDGSLVNFEKSYQNVNTGYQKKYYGGDLGLNPNYASNGGFIKAPKPLNYPVYGIIHGVKDNGLVVHIEKGSSSAELIMNPSGVRTDFYYITNKFAFRQPYLHMINSTTSSLVMQEEIAPVEVQMRIDLLSGKDADYMGIASNYRNYLKSNGLLAEGEASKDVPLMLEALMSSVDAGIFFNKIVPMTSVNQLEQIVGELRALGVDKTVVTARGLFKDSVTVKDKDRFRFHRKVGTMNDLKQLSKKMQEQGDVLALQMSYVAHYYKEYANIQPELDLLYMMNKNYLFFEYKIGLKKVKSTLLNPQGFQKYIEADLKEIEDIGNIGMSIRLPEVASSYGKDPVTREDALEEIGTILGSAKEVAGERFIDGDQGTPFAVANASGIKNILMDTTLFPYITDSVPFTSFVYHGSVDLFSQTLNTVGDPEIRKLKMVEWGIYPSFHVMHEDSGKLLYSDDWYLVSGKYSEWKEEIVDTYKFISDALKHVTGASITDHEVLESGVVQVVYSNGVSILVNYTERDFVNGNIKVAAGSYEVIKP